MKLFDSFARSILAGEFRIDPPLPLDWLREQPFEEAKKWLECTLLKEEEMTDAELQAEMVHLAKELAMRQLHKCQCNMDAVEAHIAADQILCNLLVGLGYSDVVEKWRKVNKWYS